MAAEVLSNGLVLRDDMVVGVMVLDPEVGPAVYRLRAGDRVFLPSSDGDELATSCRTWAMFDACIVGYLLLEVGHGEQGRVFTRNGASLQVLTGERS